MGVVKVQCRQNLERQFKVLIRARYTQREICEIIEKVEGFGHLVTISNLLRPLDTQLFRLLGLGSCVTPTLSHPRTRIVTGDASRNSSGGDTDA